jgi:Cu/Ag efflux protein CusF
LRYSSLSAGLAAGDAAEVQETGAESVFYGRGLVKAVAPGTGWVTLAHNDIMGCMPSMEMMFRVRAPHVSRDLRPGDTIDFTLDGGDCVVFDAKLVSHAQ